MRRLHPLTGLLRTGRYGVVALGMPLFGFGLVTLLPGVDVEAGYRYLPAAMVAVGLLGAAYGLATYLRFRYALDDRALRVASGVIARREREIPIDRIQNVDVQRELLHRILSLAVVRIETAGGTDTEAELRFVAASEATRLQEAIRRRRGALAADAENTAARSTESADGATHAEMKTRGLFALTPGDLAVYGLTEIRSGAFALSLFGLPLAQDLVTDVVLAVAEPLGGPEGLSLAMTPDEALAVVAVVVPLVLVGGWLLGAALGVLGYYGFELGRRGSDLVYERGLTTKYSGAIPVDKLQTLSITETLFQRPLGYAGLRLETAGFGAERANEEGSPSAVPLATRDRVDSFATALDGCETGPAFERPPTRARRRYAARYTLALCALAAAGLASHALVGGFTRWWVPLAGLPLVPGLAYLTWTNRGYAVGEDHLFVRSGVVRRTTTIVPYRRLQTVSRSQTVFQRRLGLAHLIVDTASSFSLIGGGAVAYDLPADTAADLRDRLRERLWIAIGTDPPGPAPGDPSATTES